MIINLTQEDIVILSSFEKVIDVLNIKCGICQSPGGGIPGGGPQCP